jgi:DNA phosphorothioation-dependent restriction protein DptG
MTGLSIYEVVAPEEEEKEEEEEEKEEVWWNFLRAYDFLILTIIYFNIFIRFYRFLPISQYVLKDENYETEEDLNGRNMLL